MSNATAIISLGGEYDSARASVLYANLSGVKGVLFVEFNYTTNKVTLSFDPDLVSLDEIKGIIAREKEGQGPSLRKLVEPE